MFMNSDFSNRMTELTTPFSLITGAKEIHDVGLYFMMETPVLFASLAERHLTGREEEVQA